MITTIPLPTILDGLLLHARERPHATAFGVGDSVLSWEELLRRTKRLAAIFAAKGLGPGERCAFAIPLSLDLVVGILAAQWTGAASVIIDNKLPPAVILRRLGLVKPLVTLVEPEMRDKLSGLMVSEAWPLCDPRVLDEEAAPEAFHHRALPEALAYLQLTSGSTGEPKAVAVSHRALALHLSAVGEALEMRVEDTCVSWVPLYHDYGLVHFMFLPVYTGCASHLLPAAVTSFSRWLRMIDRLRATVTGSPDFGYRIAARLVDPGGVDLTCLRIAGCGGEPIRYTTLCRFAERFRLKHAMMAGYGQAEATLVISLSDFNAPLRVDDSGNVSNGRPLPGLSLRICDENGRELPPGEVGHIHVKGPFLFDGYFGDPEATSACFVGEWLDTGDTGYVDGRGELFVLGRRRAMIKRGGAMIAPREVEDAADLAVGVRRCAAIGAPDGADGLTERVVLLAEIAPGKYSTLEARSELAREIAEHVERAIGNVPVDVVLVKPGALELTNNGKTRYAAIRERFISEQLHKSHQVLYPENG